jgi:hypothetical protein
VPFLDLDAPRLLHRHSPYGYTSRPAEALPDEPEAVPAAYQDVVTHRAHRDAEQRVKRERVEQREELARVLSWLRALKPGVDASRELRAAGKALERLDRRLAG